LRPQVIVVYNKPEIAAYGASGDEKAVYGVLECVRSVYYALTTLGYPVSRLSLAPPVEKVGDKLSRLNRDSIIFNLFEGFHGQPETESAVAAMMEDLGLKFTGCGSKALLLALNKVNSKELLRAAGIDTPEFQLLTKETMQAFNLNFPSIVKPAAEDASNGITSESVVHDRASLERQVEKICTLYNGKAVVEEYIEGREFNITVFGSEHPEVLPISEIIFTLSSDLPNILTYDAKWVPASPYFKGTKVACPANIDTSIAKMIGEIAVKAYSVLSCTGYARLDLRMREGEYPKVIEVNPNPDISPGTGAARQAKAAGMRYSQFIEKIVSFVCEGAAV
jgi:D-alanine-D-alanine ligase